jgi:hypothetical protein
MGHLALIFTDNPPTVGFAHKQTFEAHAAATLTKRRRGRPAANNNVRRWLAGGKVRPAQQRLLP